MGDDRWAMTDGQRWRLDCSAVCGLRSVQGLRPESRSCCVHFRNDRPCRKGNVMSGMKSYRELDTWKLAMTLVEATYTLTGLFPDTERYGLIAQMRRCAVSIPSNIAEGQARGMVRVGLHFVRDRNWIVGRAQHAGRGRATAELRLGGGDSRYRGATRARPANALRHAARAPSSASEPQARHLSRRFCLLRSCRA